MNGEADGAVQEFIASFWNWILYSCVEYYIIRLNNKFRKGDFYAGGK